MSTSLLCEAVYGENAMGVAKSFRQTRKPN